MTKNDITPSNIKVLAVLGPTAIGKTHVGIRLVQAVNAEIVSCDSVQLYRYLDIGSAKPDSIEKKAAVHHLIDVFLPDFVTNAGVYKKLAEERIVDIATRGKIPILVGGTGMYFNALYYGMFMGATRNDVLRAELENQVKADGLSTLYNELAQIDPVSAQKILPNDKRRIIRALEVYHQTQVPISRLHERNEKLPISWFCIGLNRERSEIYAQIEKRVDNMIEAGLIEETRRIAEHFGEEAFALSSIGYRHALKVLKGEWSIEEMKAQLKQDTRHYAKRQLTWFRKNPDIVWFHPDDIERILEEASRFLHQSEVSR